MFIYINFEENREITGEQSVSGVGITQFKVGSESEIVLSDGNYSETANSVAKIVERDLNSQTMLVTIGFNQRFDQSESFCRGVIDKVNKVVEIKSPDSEFVTLWGHSLREFRSALILEEAKVGYFIS